MTIIARAIELVPDGGSVGLGSGRAAEAFIKALGARTRDGVLKVHGVPTSERSAKLAQQEGVPLIDLGDVDTLDVTVDGADEVDPALNLIKGYGRALVREKIVAASSRQFVILVGTEKLVSRLGERGKLPIEVLPFALPLCLKRFRDMGLKPVTYLVDGRPFVSDNGNAIVDCEIGPIDEVTQLERDLMSIPGVVDTGLFLGMADTVLIGEGPGYQFVEERRREDLPGGEGPNHEWNATVVVDNPQPDRSSELEDAIRRRIVERTGGQIQSLTVRVAGNRIDVKGVASCFYHKQLALRGVLDAVGQQDGTQIELSVEVVSVSHN